MAIMCCCDYSFRPVSCFERIVFIVLGFLSKSLSCYSSLLTYVNDQSLGANISFMHD